MYKLRGYTIVAHQGSVRQSGRDRCRHPNAARAAGAEGRRAATFQGTRGTRCTIAAPFPLRVGFAGAFLVGMVIAKKGETAFTFGHGFNFFF
jgi:hypothetical protein